MDNLKTRNVDYRKYVDAAHKLNELHPLAYRMLLHLRQMGVAKEKLLLSIDEVRPMMIPEDILTGIDIILGLQNTVLVPA